MNDDLKEAYRAKYEKLYPLLSEKDWRIVLGGDAEALGYGGISLVSELAGVSRPTIILGRKELNGEIETAESLQVRKPGGGRKKETEKQSGLKEELESMMEPVTRGHPESILKWTCISTRNLSKELKKRGYPVGYKIVGRLLNEMGYSLQSNAKSYEASAQHPDRNAQFAYINKKAQKYIKTGEPVISVDTKKKEKLGNFKNNGKEYRKKEDARRVNAHDFGIDKAAPYGIYDEVHNEGFVNVGTSADTSEFAVDSIRHWWNLIGKKRYPDSNKLLITADGGGSNGYRVKLWKTSLQKFANKSGLEITVCHFPPGTSKWNKIEHRLFSYISLNWKGTPLIDIETMIKLIGAVSTGTGLKVKARKETKQYKKGIKIEDEDLKEVNLSKHKFHGEWNYTIKP
ncbi:MAG: ISAzo13 family transposase, partial [Rhabdochlamydiaceae bacterium]